MKKFLKRYQKPTENKNLNSGYYGYYGMSNALVEKLKIKQKRKAKIITIIVFSALLVLMLMLRLSVSVSEFFTTSLSRYFSIFISGFTKNISFSIFEVLFAFAIIYLITFFIALIVFLCKRKYFKALNSFLNTIILVTMVSTIYFFSAGFGYNRYPLPSQLFYNGSTLSQEKNLEIGLFYNRRFEYLSKTLERDNDGNIKLPYDISTLAKHITTAYNNIGLKYIGKMDYNVKEFATSKFISSMGLCGVSFAPTAEVNINSDMPIVDIVDTVAHELAHSRGVMRENDANTLAQYALLTSNDEYLEYIALFKSLYYINIFATFGMSQEEAKTNYYDKFDLTLAENENKNVSEYWKNISKGGINKIFNFFNELYLKLSGVKDGINSYLPDDSIIEVEKPGDDGEGMDVVVQLSYNDLQRIFIKHFFENA